MIRLTTAAFLLIVVPLGAQQLNIDDFFRNFTAEWVRGSPNLATSSRFFTGEEQDRLERQLTPESEAFKRQRIQLARRGLMELARFDRSKMTDLQRVSAELM